MFKAKPSESGGRSEASSARRVFLSYKNNAFFGIFQLKYPPKNTTNALIITYKLKCQRGSDGSEESQKIPKRLEASPILSRL